MALFKFFNNCYLLLKDFITFERRGSARKLSNDISEEYWRLFGSSAVPLVMKVLEGFEYPPGTTSDDYYAYLDDSHGDRYVVSKPAMAKYSQIVKNDKIIVSRQLLWEKYSGNQAIGADLDFLAKSANREQILLWLSNNYIDEGGSFEYPSDIKTWPGDSRKNSNSEVGFLFFSVKNITEKPLKNLELVFEKAEVLHTLPNTSWSLHENSFKKLEGLFKSKGNPDDYLLKKLNFNDNKNIVVNLLQPNERIVFLISVYRADQNGYENGYLDDVYKPKYIINQSEPLARPLFLRDPLRDRSARYFVPYGWFRQ